MNEHLESNDSSDISLPAPAASASAPTSGGEGRTMALLQQIQSGQTSARTVAIDDRRMLVAYLASDGYSTADIAQILKVSDRSIERDKQAIRQFNALPKDPRMVEQMAGRLVGEAELAVQRIRRAAREKLTPPAVKVDAEHRCFQIVSELVHRLQGLGYLPMASQRIEADLVHHNGDVPDLEVLTAQMTHLRELTADGAGGVPPEMKELEAEFQRAAIAIKVQQIAATTREAVDSNGGAE